jgi:hypothetical protein
MAGSLLRAGHEVTVYNRTPGAGEPRPRRLQALVARGGEQLDWSAVSQLAANDAGLR